MTEQRAEITTVQPDDPAMAVKLKARPPVIGQTYDKDPKHDRWTLDLLERTCLEFRAVGAWDSALVDLKADSYDGGGAIACEVLTARGEDAMPWGWRPSQGPPLAPECPEPLPAPVVPDGALTLGVAFWAGLLGNRVLHGVLLLVLVVLVIFR